MLAAPLRSSATIAGVYEYDVAQVCPNGHVANSTTIQTPEFNDDFCEECGEATITECPSCKRPIRGQAMYAVVLLTYRPPAFCRHCGQPFPWTASRLEAARELALEAEHLNEDERKELAGTVGDLVRDVPGTHVAAGRFKRLATKAGVGTANALRDILVDIVSETAKKVIWPT
jgi:hypothetical protein